jgi:hypothetical protein
MNFDPNNPAGNNLANVQPIAVSMPAFGAPLTQQNTAPQSPAQQPQQFGQPQFPPQQFAQPQSQPVQYSQPVAQQQPLYPTFNPYAAAPQITPQATQYPTGVAPYVAPPQSQSPITQQQPPQQFNYLPPPQFAPPTFGSPTGFSLTPSQPIVGQTTNANPNQAITFAPLQQSQPQAIAPMQSSANNGTVAIPQSALDELLAVRDQASLLRQQVAASQQAAQQAEIIAAQQNGQYQRAVELLAQQANGRIVELQTQLTSNQALTSNSLKQAEINRTLANRLDLVEGAAQHLANALMQDPMIEVAQNGNQFVVRTRTLESIDSHVSRILAAPENRLFLRATSTGGSGAVQAINTFGQAPASQQQYTPSNLGEAIIADYRNSFGAQTSLPVTELRPSFGAIFQPARYGTGLN